MRMNVNLMFLSIFINFSRGVIPIFYEVLFLNILDEGDFTISGKVSSIEYITNIHSVSTNPCFVNEPLIRVIGKGWGTKGHTTSSK